ncbi:MAG: hypothetical protein L0207_04515 [Chlamydiae bacterium]|nr:hypothetical protein [Chlamydiota bacterium]
MATITKTEFSEIFQVIGQKTSESPFYEKTNQKLLELKEKTETTFEKSKKETGLYRAVERAINIISSAEYYAGVRSNILLAVGFKISNEKLKTHALEKAITDFLENNEIQKAFDASEDIPNEEDKSRIICEIVERAIKIEELEEALEILHEEEDTIGNNVTDGFRKDIVNKFFEINEQFEKDELIEKVETPISAAIGLGSEGDPYLENIIEFLAGQDLLEQAIENLVLLNKEESLEKAVIYLAEYLNDEEEVENVIDSICKFETKKSHFRLMETFAMSLIKCRSIKFSMKVVDALVDELSNEKEISCTLARFAEALIERSETDYIPEIVEKLVDCDERFVASYNPRVLSTIEYKNNTKNSPKSVILNIIKSLKTQKYNVLAAQIEKRTKNLFTA